MEINQFRRKFRKGIDLIKPVIDGIRYITHSERHEKKVSYGIENKDKTIYIIRNSNPKAGLFSLLNTIVEKTEYALDKGYYPIVDMMNYPNSYLRDINIGKENAWDYFFEPLVASDGVPLESAYNSQNVILSTLDPMIKKYHFDSTLSLKSDSQEYQRIKDVYLKQFRIRSELVEIYEKKTENLLYGRRVVGVLCRGTDYTALKPYAHPIQPSDEDVVKKVDEFLNKGECTHIYLSTEDEAIVRRFSERYGDKLLLYPRKYVKAKENAYITDLINDECDPKNAGIDYLGQIYLLSKCKCAVLSLTSATPFVCFMSNYENIHIWNLGKYGFDD